MSQIEAEQLEPSAMPAVIGPPQPGEWVALKEQVDWLAESNLVPRTLQHKPSDIMVILLAGREIGVPPVMALSKIHVIDGRPSMSAELMLALVLRSGHELVIAHTDHLSCTVEARRRGAQKSSSFQFSMSDAETAGLAGKQVWKAHPAAMLRARAISAACRAVFPDVLMGISYVPEEVGADVDPFTGEVSAPVEETISEGDRVAFRERIMALTDSFRAQLRDTMKERGWNLARLPVRLRDDFLVELEGLESWIRPSGEPAAGDQTVVEGVLVSHVRPSDPDPEGRSRHGGDSDVTVAEVVGVCEVCGLDVGHEPGCPEDPTV